MLGFQLRDVNLDDCNLAGHICLDASDNLMGLVFNIKTLMGSCWHDRKSDIMHFKYHFEFNQIDWKKEACLVLFGCKLFACSHSRTVHVFKVLITKNEIFHKCATDKNLYTMLFLFAKIRL